MKPNYAKTTRQVTLRSLTTLSLIASQYRNVGGLAPIPLPEGFHPSDSLPRFARFKAIHSFRTAFFTSVMNICPGACVMTNGGFECMTTFCGVTPQGQNTGTSPSRMVTASP